MEGAVYWLAQPDFLNISGVALPLVGWVLSPKKMFFRVTHSLLLGGISQLREVPSSPVTLTCVRLI